LVVVILLRMAGLKATHRWLAGRHSLAVHHKQRQRPYAEAWRSARRLAGLARHLPIKGTCLQRSLALVWRSHALGIPAELRIGIATASGFAAHAWVEVDGEPIAEPMDVQRRFQAFSSRQLGLACQNERPRIERG